MNSLFKPKLKHVFDFTYREVRNERGETSTDGSPPDLLALEIMVADDGENVHDDE